MATSCVDSIYYSGQGSVLLSDRDVNGDPTGFLPVGNVSSLTISVERSVLEHKESCSGTRGIDLEIVQEFTASLSMVMESLDEANLALALYGTSTSNTASTVTNEVVTARHGKWVPLVNIDVSTVVVTNTAGTVTYVVDTDYVLNADAGSIKVLSTGAITDAQTLHVDYAFAANKLVQAMTSSTPPIKWLRFEGLNTAKGNNPVVVDVFKWSVGPLAELALINEELSQMTVEGKILMDATKLSGSQYFRQRMITA